MDFGAVNEALASFTQLHTVFKDACDLEGIRLAEKSAADAELSLATSAKDSADSASEAALAVLLVELEKVGIQRP